MKEFTATLRRSTYVGGTKTELTREVDIMSANIKTAYDTASKMNHKWTLAPQDIHEVVIEEEGDTVE